MKIKNLPLLLLFLIFSGCKFYSFSGISIAAGTETFWVYNFQNEASLIEPGIEREFTFALQDLIQNQSSLTLDDKNPHLIYEGEITQYYIAPQTATSDNVAAQNRLTISINVRFYNTKVPDGSEDFEKPFTFFFDFPGNATPTGPVLVEALEVIYERITQDIFNASLAKW
ncbi:MAG: LptE family protein [Leeuwenhoekiella sp.]